MFRTLSICFNFLIILIFSACATSPLGRSQLILMPESEVNQMGIQAFGVQKDKLPLSHDPAINDYVHCVTGILTRQVQGQWEVAVFEDDTPNAFALPGQKIGVHTGILKVAQNQDQLAAVIGHEIGHVLAHHSNERISQQFATKSGMVLTQILAGSSASSPSGQLLLGALGLGAQYGILLPFSRNQESEADLIGLDLIAKSGFDPRESIDLWQNMAAAGGPSPVEFLSTHPSHQTRIRDLQARMAHALQLADQTQNLGYKPDCHLQQTAPSVPKLEDATENVE